MPIKIALSILLVFSSILPIVHAQEKTQDISIPVGEKKIMAVADVQPVSSDNAGEVAEALKTFNQVLREDLSFSDIFIIAGKSFYPPQPIVRPETDINFDAWNSIPSLPVVFLAVGTLNISAGVLRAELSVYDIPTRKRIIGKIFTGEPDQVRAIAHLWADMIVYNLTANLSKGIASTKIAFVKREKNAKEVYIMDYDGNGQRAFTRNGSLNLFPNWAPDNSKLAFVSYRPKPEISIYSYIDGSRLPFPLFESFASTPAISPDGKEVAYSSRTFRGDADIFISNLDGSNRRNITNNPAIDTSPTWSPSGRQLAFTSNRGGMINQIFVCDSDGSNLRRVVKEGGDADSPAWSPDGRWIAFHWKPHLSNYHDIYLADVKTWEIYQLTSNHGSNENPTWAPDSRHIAFQSNRSGSSQIYIMGLPSREEPNPEPRRITNQGNNSSPAWSGYFSKGSEN
jgi:TolB protein